MIFIFFDALAIRKFELGKTNYWCVEIDDESDYDNIVQGLKDFDLFVKEIEKFLQKHKIAKGKK